jgi:signal transduction histidine kinase
VPDDVMVSADPQLLSSALFNLIQNAFKYSVPHGHVLVRTVCAGGGASPSRWKTNAEVFHRGTPRRCSRPSERGAAATAQVSVWD